MLELLGMDFDIPYDKEPFYSALFSIAVIILWVAYFRKKDSEEIETPILNNFKEIQQFDVLGQPISKSNHNHFPKEGVLFNAGGKINGIKIFLTTLGACILFGLIVGLLQ